MKIWLINHYATSQFRDLAGRHYWFAKELKGRGHDVCVFCATTFLNSGGRVETGGRPLAVKRAGGVPFIFVKTTFSSGNGAGRVYSWAQFYMNLFPAAAAYAGKYGKPDVLVASSVHPLTMVAGIQIAKRMRIPCICEVRDLWPEAIFRFGKAKEESLLGQALIRGEHWIYRHADALVFTKEGDTDYLKERRWMAGQGGDIGDGKCHYINNGIDLAGFERRARKERLDDRDLEGGKFNVVYTGTLRPINHAGGLLDAAKAISRQKGYGDVQFLVYGDGVELPALRRRVQEEGIGNVKLKGFVERRYIPYILSRSSVNVLNYAQGQYNWSRGCSSNKLFEYMASGRPILSTVRMGYSLVQRYGCGVELDEDTPQALAGQVMRFHDMGAAEYAQIGQNAKNAARDFDFQVLTDKLEEVVKSVQGTYRNSDGNSNNNSRKSRSRNRDLSRNPYKSIELIRSLWKEYGAAWAVYRGLYSGKLWLLSHVEGAERLFEHKAGCPFRLDAFSVDIKRIGELLRALPGQGQQALLKEADGACQGRLNGFSAIALDYGSPIDWQLDPLTGKGCSIKDKWYRIPDFDPGRGDIKVVWEASRFSHFLTLARAFLLSGDGKYYRAFSSQLDGWVRGNPYPYGANFKCGQECAIRMVNGLLAYTAFHNAGMAGGRDRRNIKILILRCYRKILGNFFYANKCMGNNHTILELAGMAVGAWCCREQGRLAYAYRMLEGAVDMQFTDDGGYTQHSFNYMRLALQGLEVALSAGSGWQPGGKCRGKVLAAARLMYQCQDASGDMPNYGANDGALAFPATPCGYRDFRPVINAVCALAAGRRTYEAGPYDEELLWFGGGREYPVQCTRRSSRAFGQAGLYTLRGGASWAMVVLNDYHSRPSHMDQLHLDVWAGGVNVLCDGGTYSYASDLGRALAGNSAHNTVVYSGGAQMGVHGAFLVYGWTRRGRVSHTKSRFYGEVASRNGYVHRRTVEATRRGYRVTDRVEGGGRFAVLFHTPCEVTESGGAFELSAGGRRKKAVQDQILCGRGGGQRVQEPVLFENGAGHLHLVPIVRGRRYCYRDRNPGPELARN